jgi:hypothetical protein
MMDQNIKFGFWNYIDSGKMGKEAVSDWKELGMNLCMSFDFNLEKGHNKQDMIDILDECAAQGMQLIIRDQRTRFKHFSQVGAEAFTADVQAAYADFGKHPATFGFFIGDEPNEEQVPDFIETAKIVAEQMPNLVPYGNLLPYFGSSDWAILTSQKADHYYKLLERILKESKIPVIGYDNYSQCLQADQNQEAGMDGWFYNLDMFQKACKERGIPFYVTGLCVGHWAYRVPTEDDFRWQISTALAHGARGVFWFHLYNIKGDLSYRNAPFYGENFKRTETFTYLARQQDIFRQCYMEQFNKMELTDVYHVGHIYDPSMRFCEDDTVKEVRGDSHYPAIVSYFKEFDSEERWVCIVNAHQRYSNLLTVEFTCGAKYRFWLAPGELRLFKLSEVEKSVQ